MPDEFDTAAYDRVHDVLQEVGSPEVDRPAVLTNWAVVCEWMDDSGERWLSKAFSPTMPQWMATGMYHEAIYADWGDG